MNITDLIASAVRARLDEPADLLADASTIARAKEKLPGVPVYASRTFGRLFLFRPATKQAWGNFENMAEADPLAARGGLLRACLLYPSSDEYDDALEERPALRILHLTEVIRVSGMDEAGKLRRA